MAIFTNRNGHDEMDACVQKVSNSIHALKHINNLSDKQQPVFEELQENWVELTGSHKDHKKETQHYTPIDMAIFLAKWLGGIVITLAATKHLWMPLLNN